MTLTTFLLASLLCVCTGVACAQTGDQASSNDMSFTGSATLSADFYDMQSSPEGMIAPRRPANLYRLVFTPTLSFGDLISLPFTIILNSRETNTITASLPSPSLIQFLQNPLNNLGVLSFSPRIGWVTLHLGTHQPQLSELSAGDAPIFGAGVELRPGPVRALFSAGTMQRAIDADTLHGVTGAYARRVYVAKVGIGTETSTHIDVNVVRATDDLSSLRVKPANVTPQEGVLLTTNALVVFGESVKLTGEIGASAFSDNVLAAQKSGGAADALAPVITPRTSTHVDYAATGAVDFTQPTWGVSVNSKYIGAGYVTLAYPYMQADRFEWTVAPRAQLFDGDLSVNASLGSRTNNLSNTKAAAASQVIASANVNAQFSQAFSVATSYSNFGFRDNNTNDTLKIQSVSQSFNISPVLVLTGDMMSHTISLAAGIDNYIDNNTVTGAQNSNHTQTLAAAYGMSLMRVPLSMNVSGTHMTNDLPAATLAMNAITVGASYRVGNGVLTPSVSATLSQTTLGAFTADNTLAMRVGAQWRLTNAMTLQCSIAATSYQYGSSRPGVSYNEYTLRSALTTRF